MFFAAKNLVSLTVAPCEPWSFQPTEVITDEIRNDKKARQSWYQRITTSHNFYTGIEAAANTQRCSKENPPRAIHAFVADFDIAVPAERISEAIAAMGVKPTWFETSLGGNFRLIWVLESPIPVDSRDFCIAVLQRAVKWLRLDLLPGLDQKAFEETTRLYANGCQWEKLNEPVPSKVSQAFFVDCGKVFNFKPGDDAQVPLDLVEKALRTKYPNFDWPGDFALDTQGPTFWIPESVSPQSAIVKAGGLFTFAAHASKPFYSWSDLLGADFVKGFQQDAIAKATEGVYWDSNRFWMKKEGVYVSMPEKELLSYLKVDCRLSMKPDSSGSAPLVSAVNHIYRKQAIAGAAPFCFQPQGIIVFQGERRLNTYSCTPQQPVPGDWTWGAFGGFPWLSSFFDTLFCPASQLKFFLAWWKRYYLSALDQVPRQGQNVFLMGGVGAGKTFTNRGLVARSVGGFADASDFLVNGGAFNSHLLKYGHWALDDDAPNHSSASQARMHAAFKKACANREFLFNAKYEQASMVAWQGRIFCTTNLDFLSSQIVGPLDNSSLDKTNLFKCQSHTTFVFPDEAEIVKTVNEELPRLLWWLTKWEPPPEVTRHSRFGYQSFQESSLLQQTHQSSITASFKEVLIEFLREWFSGNPKALYWEGTVSMLLKQIYVTQCNDMIMRSMKLEQVSRYLEKIQREGDFKVEVRTGEFNTRLWRFHRG